MGEIRVALADDHQLIRDGIRHALAKERNIILIGEAVDGGGAQQLCRDERPDVLLLDLNMPGPSAMETIAWSKEHCPQTKIVILTAHDEASVIRDVAEAGIAGYVLKDEATQTIVEAVHEVAAEGTWFSQAVVPKLIALRTTADNPTIPKLTVREKEVLDLLLAGLTNDEIGHQLHIARRTVRYHTRNIYDKLGVNNRVEAAVRAVQLDLLDE